MIRFATAEDAAEIVNIYNYYVSNTTVTFEEKTISKHEMAERLTECFSHRLPWLVAEFCGEIIGYAYASRWKGRCAYRHTVEITVYLAPTALSNGWGSRLYEKLLAELKNRSVHVVICGIALPNDKSVALHEKFGMTKVAHFSEVGRKFARWIDVGYWQCVLQP